MDNEKNAPRLTGGKWRLVLFFIFFGLIFTLSVAVFSLSVWYKNNYYLEFKELLYVVFSPLEGTGGSTIDAIILATVPYALLALAVFIAVAVLLTKKEKLFGWVKAVIACVCSLTLVGSLIFAAFAFRFNTYYNSMREITTLYEEYYVDPADVVISGEKPKNLLYIFVESLENTHLTEEMGGRVKEDYLPYMASLAKQNLSFSNLEEGKLGGFVSAFGSGWTVAALLSATSGIPFAFSVGANNMDKAADFAPQLTNLGDILAEKGYRQMFLCGSDADFGGRKTLFKTHGDYEIFDLASARLSGYVSPIYHNMWWGYEDEILYEIAKDKLLEMSAGDKPFNLTMLTVDTHPEDGYICDLCGDEYPTVTENVLRCADKQLESFIEWCKQQDFYDDTVIIITGDHPRHDNALVEDVPYDERTIYNCFINAAIEPSGATYGRTWTSLDLFPTTLAAMGFEIEGERLGLGTNMFSGQPTLSESLGYAYFNGELGKFSEFYLRKFS